MNYTSEPVRENYLEYSWIGADEALMREAQIVEEVQIKGEVVLNKEGIRIVLTKYWTFPQGGFKLVGLQAEYNVPIQVTEDTAGDETTII